MNSKIFVVLLIAAFTFGLWSCKDLPPRLGKFQCLVFQGGH